MAKTKTRRKAYRPKGVSALAYMWYSKDSRTDDSLKAWAAFDRLIGAGGNFEDAADVAGYIHHMAILASKGVEGVEMEEPRAYMDSATIALGFMLERHKKTGKVGCAGQELQALRYGLEMCDLLQQAATRKELGAALIEQHRQIDKQAKVMQ